MENKPRSPDADEQSYEDLMPDLTDDKRESMLRHSRKIVNSILPDALGADKKTEQIINIEHRPEAPTNRENTEKYNVENTSIELPSEMPVFEKRFESRPEKGEEDFEKKHEVKDSRIMSRFSDMDGDKYVNRDSQATPVSEVIKNIKVKDERIAIKTHTPKSSKPVSTDSQLKITILGFIFGLICLLILINQT